MEIMSICLILVVYASPRWYAADSMFSDFYQVWDIVIYRLAVMACTVAQ
jgi:hypothetical protein